MPPKLPPEVAGFTAAQGDDAGRMRGLGPGLRGVRDRVKAYPACCLYYSSKACTSSLESPNSESDGGPRQGRVDDARRVLGLRYKLHREYVNMPKGTCRLCKREADLQFSHVIPAFVFRWLRDSSANGYLRSAEAPNLRVQDGPRRHWLCVECEALLGRSETEFSTKLFHPYLNASGHRFRYGAWLLKFCVSVSWRNLLIQLEYLKGDGFTEQQQDWAAQAEMVWRSFLLGEVGNPGAFRQFLLPLDRIESARDDLPPNINRYLMRAIDIDFCHGEGSLFTYTKPGRFVVIGFVNEPNQGWWIGGRVAANEGVVEPRNYTLPAPFGKYIMSRAGHVRRAMRGLSDRQKEKIEQAFQGNADRLVGSDFFTAMQADIEMFGSAAFGSQDRSDER